MAKSILIYELAGLGYIFIFSLKSSTSELANFVFGFMLSVWPFWKSLQGTHKFAYTFLYILLLFSAIDKSKIILSALMSDVCTILDALLIVVE